MMARRRKAPADTLEIGPLGVLDPNHAVATADKTTGVLGSAIKLAKLDAMADVMVIGSDEMRTLSGAPSEGTVASGIIHCWLMDAGLTEIVGCMARLPPDWVTFNAKLVWAPSDAAAGDVRWEWRRATVAAGAVPVSSGGTTMLSTAPGVANQVVVTAASANIAVPAGGADGMHGVRISRTGGDAADTYGADAKLIAIVLTKAS